MSPLVVTLVILLGVVTGLFMLAMFALIELVTCDHH